jgi:hypothetical protein
LLDLPRWNRLLDARTASALHQASLYAESEVRGQAYHAAVEATTTAYEPTILAVLVANADVSGVQLGEMQVDPRKRRTPRQRVARSWTSSSEAPRIIERCVNGVSSLILKSFRTGSNRDSPDA